MSELKQIDTVVGDGQEATEGNHVDVHYTGWLFDDKAADHKGPHQQQGSFDAVHPSTVSVLFRGPL